MAKKKKEAAEKAETIKEETQAEAAQDAAAEAGTGKGAEEEAPEEAEKTAAERDEYLNALIRERADFENYKKRNAAAVSRAFADGQMETALLILPVLDNLERALQVEVKEESAKAIKTGVEMVEKQLREVLEKLGVEEIEALGKEFDPNLHNAVMQEEAEEGQESGIVKEVLMKGYKTKDRVLRHSMVKVTN